MERFLTGIFLSLLLQPVSLAGVAKFYCEVSDLQERAKDGHIVAGESYQRKKVGATFSVDKETGEIRGNSFINNENAREVEVIDGSDKGAFYVISKSHGPNVSVSYLSVGTYYDGSEYPFTYMLTGKYIYTGVCK